jgi:hypothetical protein
MTTKYRMVVTLPKWEGRKCYCQLTTLEKALEEKRVMDTFAMGVEEAYRRPESWIEDAQGNRVEKEKS